MPKSVTSGRGSRRPSGVVRAEREGRQLALDHIVLHKKMSETLRELNGPTIGDQLADELDFAWPDWSKKVRRGLVQTPSL